ncbi:MAG: hypothetical protein CM15mP45_20630 [Deltaproteobacteria bacterium]|nr:MAG: hypothetical protein CM15mP45_20630 [Deltaproteobacteria bacterium]
MTLSNKVWETFGESLSRQSFSQILLEIVNVFQHLLVQTRIGIRWVDLPSLHVR